MINLEIGQYRCARCERYVHNVFEKKSNGTVVCVDCTKDIEAVVGSLELQEVNEIDDYFYQLRTDIYFNYLLEDIDIFYPHTEENTTNYLERFVDSEGSIIQEKLMFQNNTHEQVEYLRFIALEFRDTIADKEFGELSLLWINRYISLRERTVTEEEYEEWLLESDLDKRQLYAIK